MLIRKLQLIVSTGVIVLFAVFILSGLLGTAAPVLAREQTQELPTELDLAAVINDSDAEVLKLDGSAAGTGSVAGKVNCIKDHCSNKMILDLAGFRYVYRFSSKVSLDPVNRRAVVGGTGTLINVADHQKERFSFTATVEDNGDGTLFTKFETSIPEISFIIPTAEGTIGFGSR